MLRVRLDPVKGGYAGFISRGRSTVKIQAVPDAGSLCRFRVNAGNLKIGHAKMISPRAMQLDVFVPIWAGHLHATTQRRGDAYCLEVVQ